MVETKARIISKKSIKRTRAKLVDDVVDFFLKFDRKVDEVTGHLRSKYELEGGHVLYRVNLYKPPPVFEIFENDIPKDIRAELDELDDENLDDVIKEAIYRLLDILNVSKFKIDVPRRNIRWVIKGVE